MTFLWPSMLLTLLAVPLIVWAYLRLQGRRAAVAASLQRFAGLQTAASTPGFRRHVPPLFSLVSLVIILLALARPHAQINLPRVEGTVMLVLDVSASMGATDVEPSRLEAAKTAARDFIVSQPETIQIGIVSFSNSGFTVQTPTNDTNALLNTISRLEPTSGTSLGQGILSALHAIAVDAGLATEEQGRALTPDATPPPDGVGGGDAPSQLDRGEEALLAQLPEGEYPPSVIVLLSDGEDNQSIDPLRAAEAAAEHAVRVDAIGFGTTAGATLEVDGFNVHTALDEGLLQQITEIAGGEYYPAQGDQDLSEVYTHLTPQLVVKPESMEITGVLAGAGVLILLVGSLLSMVWFNRLL